MSIDSGFDRRGDDDVSSPCPLACAIFPRFHVHPEFADVFAVVLATPCQFTKRRQIHHALHQNVLRDKLRAEPMATENC